MSPFRLFPIIILSLVLAGCGGDDNDVQTTPNPSDQIANEQDESNTDNTSNDDAQTTPGSSDETANEQDKSDSNDTGNVTGGNKEEGDNRVAITADNSKAVVSHTYQLFEAIDPLAESFNGFIATGAIVQESGQHFSIVRFAKKRMELIRNLKTRTVPSQLVTGALIEENEPCFEGGNISYIINDNDDNDEISKGDTVRMTVENCKESLSSETVNGQMAMAIIDVQEEPNMIVEMNVKMSNFTIANFEGSSSFEGSFNIREEGTPDETFSSLLMKINNISITVMGITETLSNCIMAVTLDMNTLTLTRNTKGTLNSTILGGLVSFETPNTFQQSGQDIYPYSGSMKITGANNSSVTLTILNAAKVRLDVDSNGDNATNHVFGMTWEELIPL